MPTHNAEPVEAFIAEVEWRFAKTMPQWPHWYVMKAWNPGREIEFMELVRRIFEEGRDEQWGVGKWERTVRYYFAGGFKYWVMDPTIEATNLINRARIDGMGPVPDAKNDRHAEEPAARGASAITRRDRYVGALLGLAAGDALGTTLEFRAPGTFTPIQDMVGGGPFGLAAGQWTDDTSMALCLAECLVECKGFDAGDQMRRYVRWMDEGYWSSTGRCFDIGTVARGSLSRFKGTGEPFAGPTDASTAGNGSLMRLAPVPLFFANDPELAIRMSADSSRTTHDTPAAVDACRYFAGLMVGALGGASKEELLSAGYSPVPGLWERSPLHPAVAAVAEGSFRTRRPPAIRGTGYVVACLEAALWAFVGTEDFRSGALAAVNLGDDADTTGAVFGQVAGAFYGMQGIPEAWRSKVVRAAEIERLGENLRSGPTNQIGHQCASQTSRPA